MKALVLVHLALALISAVQQSSSAQTPTPSPTPACVAPEFRQFDFWLGRWKVKDPQGKQIGTSEISRVSEGCAIREQWRSASGKGGTSINYYDAADREWHQHWVGGDGTILHLHGVFKDGGMVLIGETNGAKGPVTNRIIWSPLPDGKVKQEWSTSSGNRGNWQIAFTGIYEKQS